MPHRQWFQPGVFGLDFQARNSAGSPAAKRGSEHAALTCRLKGKTVSLAKVGADESAAAQASKADDK